MGPIGVNELIFSNQAEITRLRSDIERLNGRFLELCENGDEGVAEQTSSQDLIREIVGANVALTHKLEENKVLQGLESSAVTKTYISDKHNKTSLVGRVMCYVASLRSVLLAAINRQVTKN